MSLVEDYYANRISLEAASKQMGYGCAKSLTNDLKRRGQWKAKDDSSKKWPFDEAFFETIDTEAKAYWLGFLMADGCVYIGKKGDHLLRVHLNRRDDTILSRFLTDIGCQRPLIYSGDTVEVKLFSKRLIKDLIRQGCTQRKSLTLEFPTCVPDRLIHHFIRGYFDGDGTICFGKGAHRKNGKGRFYWIKAAFYCSYAFGTGLHERLLAEGFYTRVNPKGKIVEVIMMGFDNAARFHNYLYHDATGFLQRKRDKFVEGDTKRLKRDQSTVSLLP